MLIMSSSTSIAQKVWSCAHVLNADGVSHGDYVEQLEDLGDDNRISDEIKIMPVNSVKNDRFSVMLPKHPRMYS